MAKVRKAVIPVAGWGTRFLPATKAMPKEMLTVVDKPVVQYALEEARAAGIEEFIFVTGRGKQTIENHFDRSFELEEVLEAKGRTEDLELLKNITPPEGCVMYTRQARRRGLGHAVLCARSAVGDEPFAVLLPDDIVFGYNNRVPLKEMVETFEEHEKSVVLCMEVAKENTTRYGILDTGGAVPQSDVLPVQGFVEKPSMEEAPSNMAVMGRYVFTPEVWDLLEKTEAGAGGEIQLTDAMETLAKEQGFMGQVLDGIRLDCGDRPGFVKANIFMALNHPELKSEIAEFIKELDIDNPQASSLEKVK